ncbi:MAG: septal ring lytic transglycosylase RlpA family protein [Sphingomonadaceae bacterium]|nr:septal ring lytic transglycosylase RlpA family protein [Sphingomonadaceae bacterium]
MLTLAGCGMMGGDVAPRTNNAPTRPADMVSDTPVIVGAPYSIAGQRYVPSDQADYDEVGYASWYGGELEGRPTANGEAFRPSAVSAAHRTLPLPSYVEVTRLDTGRTILVRINDRGPADPNRLIDLSAGAAEQLGIADNGMAQVRVRRVNPPEGDRMTLRRGEAALRRIDTPQSLLEILRERVARLPRPSGYAPPSATTSAATPAAPNAPRPPATNRAPSGDGPFSVQIGAFSSRERAEILARRLGARVEQSGNIYRVRTGPFATAAAAEAELRRLRSAGQPGAVIQRGP